MRRTGSIFTTLAVALVATVGVAGGGYTIVTGNSIASLVATCDTPTGAVATPVAYNGGGPTCDGDKAKAFAASNKSECSKPKDGAKAVAVGDKAGCDMKGKGAKGAKGADCDMKGGKDADCGMTCEGVKTVGVADAGSHCDKPGAKAVAVGDKAGCDKSGAKAVASVEYNCKADSMFNEEQMTARAELHESLFPKIQSVSDEGNGYDITFPACSKTLVQVAEMVALSRECCDFLDYAIVADSKRGSIHLVMTGDANGKAFLDQKLAPMVTNVADTTGADDHCAGKAKAVAAADGKDCDTKGMKAAADGKGCDTKGGKAMKTAAEIEACKTACESKKAGKVNATETTDLE